MAKTAQDTFVAQLKDGSSLRVQRGSTWPDKHEVVALDGGRDHLFKNLDLGEDEKPAKSAAAEPKAVPEAAAPVKPAPAGRGKAS